MRKTEGGYNIRALGRQGCSKVYLQFNDVNNRITLGEENTSPAQLFQIKKPQVDEVIELPKCGQVTAMGKIDGFSQLAWSEQECDKTQHLVQADTEADRFSQRWRFTPVQGINVYRIVAKGNSCEEKFLSASAACNDMKVTLQAREEVDTQTWTVEAVEGYSDRFTVYANGRETCGRLYLHASEQGKKMILWNTNDSEN